MRQAAMEHLESWLVDARDPDLEQRRWKLAYADGGITAYERLGILSPVEAARWRERFAREDSEGVDSATLGPGARVAAERYVADLVGRVTPLRRTPGSGSGQAVAECQTAIDALHAVGALGEHGYASWRARLLAAQAPWLDHPTSPPPPNALFAISVPPENAEQAAEDAAYAAAWAARPKAKQIRRVVIGTAERHDDLVIVAVIVHEDATSLHFHFLGEPEGSGDPRQHLDAFRKTTDGLIPPILRDNTGSKYEPVDKRPSACNGAGGMPDPNRRQAISGSWLYTPAAPTDADAFVAQRDGHHWLLTGR